MRIAWLVPGVVAAVVASTAGASSAGCSSSAPPAPPATPAAPPRATPPGPLVEPASRYPRAERRPVTDSYRDVKVVDDYRWLESGKDPNVIAWTAAQNQLTRRRLDALPDRALIYSRVSELLSSRTPSYRSVVVTGTGVLALERHPPKQQAMLVALGDLADPASERIVFDPNDLDPSGPGSRGGRIAIDFFVPSPGGKLVAISVSRNGSETGDVHVHDLATGARLPDVVPRVNGGTAGGSLAWNAEATGFWYTRYPRDAERPAADMAFYQQVYYHKLGTRTEQDAYVLGKDFPRIAETRLRASPDGRTILVIVANGDGGEHAFYTIDARGGGTAQLFRFADKVVDGRFGPDGTLYFISHRGAPRGQIVRLARPYAINRAEVIVPEGDAVLDDLAVTASQLYVVEMLGGPSRLRKFRLVRGKATAPELIDAPYPIASISSPRPIGSDDLLYLAQSYTTTPAWFRYVARTEQSVPTALTQPMAFSMDDVEVVRRTCTSADGTQVPLNILHRRGIVLDGSHPTLLQGYGGYGISLVPRLIPLNRMWIEQGGIYAEANLRGGNEFGETWHEAGKLTSKQRVFDDFYACQRELVASGYTTPARLAIHGRSNGGLLMGAALVQHPEMVRAVVSGVGIYDMLRAELTPNGAFNVTEYGTVTEPQQFRALHAYSPYHHVVDGTPYPAVLLTTGANDPRVDPYHSRKMAARLQAASSSDRPILLRATDDTGHGIASPLGAVIDEQTDVYAFLMHELGMRYLAK